MKLKTFAVAAVAAAGLALGAGAADAKTKVHIGVGIGDNCGLYGENCYIPSPGPGYYGGYDQDTGIYYRARPRYRYDDYDDDYGRLSCGEARRMVRRQGFRGVRPDDCSGARYRFTGFRRGEAFSIRVSARSGRIISIRPLGY